MPIDVPIVLGAPVTHSDWMHRGTAKWGPQGIHYMLDQCKAAGWTRIYWRTFNGGRTLYKSAFADPVAGWDADCFWRPQTPEDRLTQERFTPTLTPSQRARIASELTSYDYTQFDTLAEAVRYGHSIGLEIHAWVSINEDDHGWGAASRFTKEHPESRWVKRDGTTYHSQQSFAYPAVQEYKLNIVRELIENYEIDGLFLDWMRTGDVRDDPQYDANGVANFGYEKPLVDSFKEKHGIDPHELPNGDERWIAWRAEPQTRFMRTVRKLQRATKPNLKIAIMGQHPWSYRGLGDKIDGNLRGLLLDVRRWAEEGLIDSAVAAGYYRDGGDGFQAGRWLQTETRGKIDVWCYGWVPERLSTFDKDVDNARRLGARHMLLWEADYLDARSNKIELQEHMRTVATTSNATP